MKFSQLQRVIRLKIFSPWILSVELAVFSSDKNYILAHLNTHAETWAGRGYILRDMEACVLCFAAAASKANVYWLVLGGKGVFVSRWQSCQSRAVRQQHAVLPPRRSRSIADIGCSIQFAGISQCSAKSDSLHACAICNGLMQCPFRESLRWRSSFFLLISESLERKRQKKELPLFIRKSSEALRHGCWRQTFQRFDRCGERAQQGKNKCGRQSRPLVTDCNKAVKMHTVLWRDKDCASTGCLP